MHVERGNEYYITYLPFDEVPKEVRSEMTFDTKEAALKHAKKKLGFRASLLTTCQNEFTIATQNV